MVNGPSSHGVDCSIVKLLGRLMLVGDFVEETPDHPFEFRSFEMSFCQLLGNVRCKCRGKLTRVVSCCLGESLGVIFSRGVKVKLQFHDLQLHISKIRLAFHEEAFRHLIDNGSVYNPIVAFCAMLSDRASAIRATGLRPC